MRKLTARFRRHLIHRQQVEEAKRQIRPLHVMGVRRQMALTTFEAVRAKLGPSCQVFDEQPGVCIVRPPEDFSLERNYEGVLTFLYDFRKTLYQPTCGRPAGGPVFRWFADFANIQQIGPAAGLMLAAEIDRSRIATRRAPRSSDKSWHPEIRRFFVQAGLFELLGIKQESDEGGAETSGEFEALKFVRGFSVMGERGSRLRDALEVLCGRRIGTRTVVYDAIAEAIANTRHAYPRNAAIWPMKATGRWWASGSWAPARDVVTMQLYDQGVGIPSTLPRSQHWADILNKLGISNRLHPEAEDQALIRAALEVGRTSTRQPGRGKGLADMAGWIEERANGFLRITSGRGAVTYMPNGRSVGVEQSVPFPGTLIEWEISLRD